jgi:hypothetical protein
MRQTFYFLRMNRSTYPPVVDSRALGDRGAVHLARLEVFHGATTTKVHPTITKFSTALLRTFLTVGCFVSTAWTSHSHKLQQQPTTSAATTLQSWITWTSSCRTQAVSTEKTARRAGHGFCIRCAVGFVTTNISDWWLVHTTSLICWQLARHYNGSIRRPQPHSTTSYKRRGRPQLIELVDHVKFDYHIARYRTLYRQKQTAIANGDRDAQVRIQQAINILTQCMNEVEFESDPETAQSLGVFDGFRNGQQTQAASETATSLDDVIHGSSTGQQTKAASETAKSLDVIDGSTTRENTQAASDPTTQEQAAPTRVKKKVNRRLFDDATPGKIDIRLLGAVDLSVEELLTVSWWEQRSTSRS